MATVAATDSTFSEIVAGDDRTILVDFWAAWCGPCRQFAPVFEAASVKHPDVTFVKVDVDANPALAQYFRVSSIPTLVAIRDNIVVFSQPGALPAPALEQVVAGVSQLDMDEVRAAVEPTAAD